jgi:DNA-binding MarR family transcriptional regulator
VTNTSNSAIDPDILRLAATLLRMSRELDHDVRQASPNQPLSVADLSVMRQIERGHDLPSLVARALQLDPGRVSRITDTLVALGYISRSEDQADRRRCRLELTPTGVERLRAGQSDVSSAMYRLLAGLSDTERQGLTQGLEGARRVLEER